MDVPHAAGHGGRFASPHVLCARRAVCEAPGVGDLDDVVASCVDAVRARRLLPVEDPRLPSAKAFVAALDATAWDPAGLRSAVDRVAAHADILTMRLVRGRPTFVHRRAWQDLLTVATSRAPWQMDFLAPTEADLLDVVERQGVVAIDAVLGSDLDAHAADLGRTLLARLLVRDAGPARLPSGATVRSVESWAHWAARTDPDLRPLAAIQLAAATERLDDAARALGPSVSLPWWKKPLRRRW